MKCRQHSICCRDWGGGFNPSPHLLKMTPTLVTENFCLRVSGVGFDPTPPPVPIQQDQHNVQMLSKYAITMVKDRITVC